MKKIVESLIDSFFIENDVEIYDLRDRSYDEDADYNGYYEHKEDEEKTVKHKKPAFNRKQPIN